METHTLLLVFAIAVNLFAFLEVLSLPVPRKERSPGDYTRGNLKVGDIIEKDIVVNPQLIAMIENRSQKKGVVYDPNERYSYRWPEAKDANNKKIIRVPYVLRKGFFTGLSKRTISEIKRGIADFNQRTCIRFVDKEKDERDFIEVFPGTGCWAEVGRRLGHQQVSLGEGCEHKGHVIHEFMHALGFLHEQSRMDRDDYVTIHWNNVEDGKDKEFKKYHQETNGLPYDFISTMHYNNKDFAKDKDKYTVTANNDPTRSLGNNNDFSALDIIRINQHYGCPQLVTDIATYEMTVYTSDRWLAGTDAFVYVELTGESGDSGETDIARGGYIDDFERGSVHKFSLAMPHVNKLKQLNVRLVRRAWFDSWLMDKIEVFDPRRRKTFVFHNKRWISPGDHVILKPEKNR